MRRAVRRPREEMFPATLVELTDVEFSIRPVQLLRFHAVGTSRSMSALATRPDLATRRVRQPHRSRIFLHSDCALGARFQTAGFRVRLGSLGLCCLHHGMWNDPYFRDLDTLVSRLRCRRCREGADGAGFHIDCNRPVAAIAESSGDAVTRAIAQGQRSVEKSNIK